MITYSVYNNVDQIIVEDLTDRNTAVQIAVTLGGTVHKRTWMISSTEMEYNFRSTN